MSRLSDDILEAVGRHCPRLHTLYASDCKDASGEQAALLLDRLPSLRDFRCSIVGEAIKRGTGQTRLETLQLDRASLDVVEAVVARCPEARRVILLFPEVGVLAGLSALPRLDVLYVREAPYLDLRQLLRTAGPRLKSVTLHGVMGNATGHHTFMSLGLPNIGMLILSEVAALCPALEELVVSQCILVTLGPCSWPALRRLILRSGQSPTQLLHLLHDAPLLRSFSVGCNPSLRDEDAAALCGQGRLRRLRQLELFSFGWPEERLQLTRAAVLAFITHCPKLKVLGPLQHWQLSAEERDELALYVRRCNLDIKFDSFVNPGAP